MGVNATQINHRLLKLLDLLMSFKPEQKNSIAQYILARPSTKIIVPHVIREKYQKHLTFSG